MKNSQKNLLILGFLVIAIILGIFFAQKHGVKSIVVDENEMEIIELSKNAANSTYEVGGKKVTLENGVSRTQDAPDSASFTEVSYFGHSVTADINEDAALDTVFVAKQTNAGTGVIYYLLALLGGPGMEQGSVGFYLGDRIEIKKVEAEGSGIIAITYLDRKDGESFVVPPTVEKKLRVRFNKDNLHFTTESLSVVNPETAPETIPDASGAAGGTELDSAELFIKPWSWVSTKNADGSVVTSKSPDKFVLTFTAPNSFGATTDCNGVGGNFEATGETVIFSNMISTMMFCEGSQESEFSAALSKVESYELNSNNELVLKLNDGGMMNFK